MAGEPPGPGIIGSLTSRWLIFRSLSLLNGATGKSV